MNKKFIERKILILYSKIFCRICFYSKNILICSLTNKKSLFQVQQIVGWLLAIIFIAGSLFGAHPLFQIDHPYNKWESSIYIGFYRLFWSLGIGWLFLACSTGYGGNF